MPHLTTSPFRWWSFYYDANQKGTLKTYNSKHVNKIKYKMGILDDLLSKQSQQSGAYNIVRQRANEAGWKIKTDNSGGIVIGFKDELGIEDVYISVCGKNNENKTILEFSSSGIPLPDDISASALFGLTLLERNGEMKMGHWGIEDINGNKFFTVFHSMLAEGMDVDEFKGAVRAVLDEKKRILLDAAISQLKKK